MKSFLTLFVALSLLTIISAFPSPDACRWRDPISGDAYDFTTLNSQTPYKLADLSTAGEDNLFNIDFLFNFCQPIPGECNGVGNLAAYEALEVMGQITDACEVLGKLDQMDVVTGTTMGAPGVKITYNGGEICSGSENAAQNGQPMSISFNIICGPHPNERVFQQMIFNGEGITKCTPEFFITHPAGCVGGIYETNDSSIFKWVIIAVVVYIVGGTIYNMKVQNLKGIDALPHVKFWRQAFGNFKNFPGMIKESAEKIMQKFKKGQSTGSGMGGFAANQKLTSGSKSAQYTLV